MAEEDCMPLVTIIRDAGYVDRLRAYQIMIDGQTVGELKNGEIKQFSVPAGQHQLAVKVDWCGSKRVHFKIAEGETLEFDAKSNVRGKHGYGILWTVFFDRYSYLALEQRQFPSSAETR